MKQFFFLAILFFNANAVSSQQLRVNIVMKNETKSNSLLGTAILYNLPDSNVITTKNISDRQSFTVAAYKNYLLKITATGTAEIWQHIAVKDSSLNFNLTWRTKTTDLGSVVVVSRKQMIKQEDDKTIVDAEPLANSSSNAYEVLEKTPGAIVDQDGNVYLNSATPAVVQINGREVKLGAADLTSLLKSLPANSIVKIEILRTPSAKFDAASSGGIINIVLKKGVKLGTSGSVNAGYFQGKLNTKFGGFNLNRSVNKINTSFSYNYTNRNNFEELNSNRYLNKDTLYDQKAYTRYPGANHFINFGIDAELNKTLTIGYDMRFSTNNNKSNAENDIDVYDLVTNTQIGKNASMINNRSTSNFISNDIYAKLKIDSLGSNWETEISFDFFRNKNQQSYLNEYLQPANDSVSGKGDVDGRKNIITVTSDLVWKLPRKYTLETGGKFNSSNSRNSSFYYINDGSSNKLDSSQSNRFKYKEEIGSLYLQLSKTFAGFTVKPGLRMEYTNISGTQLFPDDTSLNINRTDFFPYVYIRRDLFKMMGFMLTGNLVYRKSISRPYYEALNPYRKLIDQYLFEIGNPRLKPQFTTTYEFNIQADDFPVVSIGINDIKDIFTSVTYQPDSIVYRTFDNIGKNKETYVRVTGGIPPGDKYVFYAGAQYNHSDYSGLYGGRPLDYKRGSWTFFTYHNFKPSKLWAFTLNGFMRLKGLQNFYEIDPVGQLNFSVNRSLLNKKMNVVLSVNDMFYTNKYTFKIDQPTISAKGERFNDTRRVGLTVRYNFGIKPKEEKTDNFTAPAEGGN
ncbi:MAG: outer membrane beta-barrel protein [Rhizobacter sp.]|nr:outer membrane beta-barrel protein [Ferruginibacter sp.]